MSSVKKSVGFYVNAEGDGSSSEIIVRFASDPIALLLPSSSYTFTFSITAALPSSIDIGSISVSGATISGTPTYDSITHQLTIILTAAPANGALLTVTGKALYD